jgi:pimeloyl-ACP methyl ester carboxylesterase
VPLLHGWPQTSHAWRHVVPLLADRYMVTAPDLSGQVAWTYAALWPEKVEQLVLMECAIPAATRASIPELNTAYGSVSR